MGLLQKAALVFVVVLISLVVIGLAGGYWFTTKSFPQINGTVKVPGLKARVEIVRDSVGVPHIYAENVDDLFFAQGYIEAQDRLWQMEFFRRVGTGTLSDVLGSAAIKQDRYLRTIGLARAARADVAELSTETYQILRAFANGVSAFIDSNAEDLPIEFSLLGFKPAAWEPTDTLTFGKVMAMDLGGNYETELLRASLTEKFGREKTNELLPPYPTDGPFTISPDVKDYRMLDRLNDASLPHTALGVPDLAEISYVHAPLGFRSPEVGSNNWVVDGTKTTSGKPILANDTHLGIQMPAIWYEIGLHCVTKSDACRFDVAGFTFPGVPGVIIGHNDRIAWGVTNLGPDVQDLYIEKINPANSNQYEYQGMWEEMQVVEEPIKVKGVVSETLRVQITRHGPIMTPVLPGVAQPLALKWTAIADRSHLFESVYKLDQARNWDEFRSALALWDVPSQNFVYADTDGNIGYQMPGNIPFRAKGDGSVPVPGWTGEYEWLDRIPFEQLPFIVNPSTHFVATANNAVIPQTLKYQFTVDWSAPYREQRIIDLLGARNKLAVADMKSIQGDVYSIPVVKLQKQVLTLTPEGFLQQRAMQFVKTWDGRLTTENVGGTILEVTYQKLLMNLFANKMGKQLFASYQTDDVHARQAVLALLDQPTSEWWDDPDTQVKEGRGEILSKSLAQAVDWLGSQFGDAPEEWRWGRLHTATFGHPIGSVQPLDRLFNAGPIPVPGGAYTLFATSYKGTAPYAASSITSMRQVLDLANWDNAIAIHTTGQSGQPLSKHYADMVMMWRNVEYAPFYFGRQAVDKSREGLLVLTP